MSGWTERGRLRPALLLGAGVVVSLVVAVTAQVRPELAVAVGASFSGLVAVGAGCVVAALGSRSAPGRRLAPALLGAAMVVWGAGQVLLGVDSDGPLGFPSAGDRVSPWAAPLALAGLLLAMRPTSIRTHWVRMLLDSVLLAVATTLLLWRTSFMTVLGADGLTSEDRLVLLYVLIEVCLLALLLLGWLRDLDAGLALMTLGFALYTVADLVSMRTAAQGGAWRLSTAVLWCLAWPLVGEGILRFRPVESDDDGRGSETRVAAVTTVVTLVGLVGSLLETTVHRYLDGVSVALAVLVVVVYSVRELYAGAQRGRMLEILTRHALHDPLTGLGNRRALQARLARLTTEPHGAVLTLDLDGFKEVNDLLGHSSGDQLLVAVAGRIRECMPAGSEAFRVGGDEFLVLVPGEASCSNAVADALLVGVRRATDSLPGAGIAAVSASIGISRWAPVDEVDASSGSALTEGREVDLPALAVLRSGVALHAAKQSGRDRVESYDGPIAARHRRSLDVERRLRLALERGDLDVHYQPILDLDSGRVVGIEALARWVDPVLGRVGPDEFIAAAERSALIGELGMHVLERALRDVRSLDAAHPDLHVAVNVSPVQLRSPSFAAHVEGVAARHGLEPARLVVEVTESVFVADDDGDVALLNLQRLRRSGINVAIDDFGSGYSSLNYLSRLPASILKVDQGLTASVIEDPRALSVLRAVVELGRSVSMDVAVEGIETQQMHDIVRSFGGCFGQGWLYSAAVPLSELCALIADVDSRVALSA